MNYPEYHIERRLERRIITCLRFLPGPERHVRPDVARGRLLAESIRHGSRHVINFEILGIGVFGRLYKIDHNWIFLTER